MCRALGPSDPSPPPCRHCAVPSQACPRAPRPQLTLHSRPAPQKPAQHGPEAARACASTAAAPAPSRPRGLSTLYSCSRESRPGLRHSQDPDPPRPWPRRCPGHGKGQGRSGPAVRRQSTAAARPSRSGGCTAFLRSSPAPPPLPHPAPPHEQLRCRAARQSPL